MQLYNLIYWILLLSTYLIHYRINCTETIESGIYKEDILDNGSNTHPFEHDIWDNNIFLFTLGSVVIVALTIIIIVVIYFYIKCDHCPRKRKAEYNYQPINITNNNEEPVTIKLKSEEDVDPMSPDSDSDEEPNMLEDL